MRYVIVLCSLFVVGCATQKQSAGGGTPSELLLRPGQAGNFREGPRSTPEDRSRFENWVGENQVRDLEHPAGK
jgi:hypothetical protein